MITALLPAVAAMSFTVPALGDDFERRLSGRDDGIGAAVIELFVSPQGRIDDCEVTYTEYEEAANARLCRLLRDHEVEQPARGADGAAMHGRLVLVRTSEGIMQLPDEGVYPPPELEIAVASLFSGEERETITVALLVDVQGAVLQCEGFAASPLTAAACKQAMEADQPVKRTANGVAVNYVSPVTVDFVAADG